MFGIFSKRISYFPGCLTSSVLPQIVQNYIKIFTKLKIDFHLLTDITCCGAVAYNNGYTKDFENIRERNLIALNSKNIKTIVTNSGTCLRTFLDLYKFKALHVTQLLSK